MVGIFIKVIQIKALKIAYKKISGNFFVLQSGKIIFSLAEYIVWIFATAFVFSKYYTFPKQINEASFLR